MFFHVGRGRREMSGGMCMSPMSFGIAVPFLVKSGSNMHEMQNSVKDKKGPTGEGGARRMSTVLNESRQCSLWSAVAVPGADGALLRTRDYFEAVFNPSSRAGQPTSTVSRV